MPTLKEVLGADRWAQVQQSALHDDIRNCAVHDVTIGEAVKLAELFDYTIEEMCRQLYYHD